MESSEEEEKQSYEQELYRLITVIGDRRLWFTKQKLQEYTDKVLALRSTPTKKRPGDYGFLGRYDIAEVLGERRLVRAGDKKQVYLSLEEVYCAVKEAHEACGHGGEKRTEKELSKRFANVTREQVKLYLATCRTCALKKGRNKNKADTCHYTTGSPHPHTATSSVTCSTASSRPIRTNPSMPFLQSPPKPFNLPEDSFHRMCQSKPSSKGESTDFSVSSSEPRGESSSEAMAMVSLSKLSDTCSSQVSGTGPSRRFSASPSERTELSSREPLDMAQLQSYHVTMPEPRDTRPSELAAESSSTLFGVGDSIQAADPQRLMTTDCDVTGDQPATMTSERELSSIRTDKISKQTLTEADGRGQRDDGIQPRPTVPETEEAAVAGTILQTAIYLLKGMREFDTMLFEVRQLLPSMERVLHVTPVGLYGLLGWPCHPLTSTLTIHGLLTHRVVYLPPRHVSLTYRGMPFDVDRFISELRWMVSLRNVCSGFPADLLPTTTTTPPPSSLRVFDSPEPRVQACDCPVVLEVKGNGRCPACNAVVDYFTRSAGQDSSVTGPPSSPSDDNLPVCFQDDLTPPPNKKPKRCDRVILDGMKTTVRRLSGDQNVSGGSRNSSNDAAVMKSRRKSRQSSSQGKSKSLLCPGYEGRKPDLAEPVPPSQAPESSQTNELSDTSSSCPQLSLPSSQEGFSVTMKTTQAGNVSASHSKSQLHETNRQLTPAQPVDSSNPPNETVVEGVEYNNAVIKREPEEDRAEVIVERAKDVECSLGGHESSSPDLHLAADSASLHCDDPGSESVPSVTQQVHVKQERGDSVTLPVAVSPAGEQPVPLLAVKLEVAHSENTLFLP
ncbi:uncharacterized protein LOC143297009 [Babylonia areolata]|uniref:uncharacterized protein LOC143297009 n=1 Tax=Babylonia areolata TaxID=304850 RepID=UPI003FD46182